MDAFFLVGGQVPASWRGGGGACLTSGGGSPSSFWRGGACLVFVVCEGQGTQTYTGI